MKRIDRQLKKALRKFAIILEAPPVKYYYGLFFPQIGIYEDIEFFMYPNEQGHNKAHLHAKYQGEEVVIGIPSGEIIIGSIKRTKQKAASKWVVENAELLLTKWNELTNGVKVSARPKYGL